MSDEINVFMDPFLKIYTNPDQIAVADGLTESFHKDIVLRATEKPNTSVLDIVESKLNDAKERKRQREKIENDKEKQVATVDHSKELEFSNVDKTHKEKCLEEQNKQTMAEDPCEVTKEKQHMKAGKDQREQILDTSSQMTNEEAMIKELCVKATDIHKTKQSEGVEPDHLQDQHDARMEKVILTQKPSKTNPSEPKEHNEEVMKIQKEEQLFEVVFPDAKESQDDTDNGFGSKVIENSCIKLDSMENIENIITQQENEHLYEIPDDLLASSAEYIHETERVKEQLKHLDNITLHIAVTGSTGAGKSSFINAMRGLQPDDVNAAPTGAIETTMEPTAYTHPTMPNVKLWDLPGTGSPKFKSKRYLKEVKLETFDFFIIISSERFKENDIMLAEAIKKRKKLFYFLRSKIDNDIQAESQRKDFDEQKMLSQIREYCLRNLKDVDNPNIFLISSFELHKYDFQNLIDTLEKQLPAHKRDALVLSLPIYSSKILEKKIETFMKQTQSAAVASGSIAVAPVPGLSIACDAAILLGFFTKCYYALGLDDESIDKLSVRVNNPSLKSVRSSPLVVAIGQKKLSNKELSALTSKEAAVKFAWSMLPVVGSKRTAEMSYLVTLNLLQAGLQDLADTAREVLKAAGLTDVY